SVQSLTQGAANLDYGYHAGTASNGCVSGHTYAAGDICTVLVTFAPKATGPRYGAASLTDTTGNVIATGYAYGSGSGAQVTFSPPAKSSVVSGLAQANGVTIDSMGNLYISEQAGDVLKETLQSGGTYTQSTVASGLGTIAGGVAVDGAGNVYVTNYSAGKVFKETLQPNATYTQSTVASGLGAGWGVVVDGSGDVYAIDNNHGTVLKETLQIGGSYTQSTVVTGLSQPLNGAIDGSGNIYIASNAADGILKETLQPDGTYLQSVVETGIPSIGVAVDGSGNVYLASSYSVQKETLQPGGTYTLSVIATGVDSSPYDLAVDGGGNVYIVNFYGNNVVKLDYADPPSLSFLSTPVGQTSTDSPQTFTMTDIGNAALTFPASAGAANPYFTSSTNYSLDSSTTCPQLTTSSSSVTLAVGASCVYAVDFKPVSAGAHATSLLLFDSSLSAPGYSISQTINITGTGTGVSITLSPGAGPLAGGTVGTSYGQTISASGGVGAYSYAVTSGALPNGLTLTNTGTLSGTPTAAGSYSFTITATDSSTPTTFSGSQSYTVVIAPGTSSVSGTTPTLTYGQSGSSTVTVTGAIGITPTGTVSYSIDSGTAQSLTLASGSATVPIPSTLANGAHTVTLTYNGSANYLTSTSTVHFTIGAATPLIAWAAPASITFGTALSASQLNATASYNATAVPGIFTYTPALSTVLAAGPQTLSVTFTPTDATDYNSVNATVVLTVTKVTPVVAWAAPASITYGTALSATQLNATASYNATAVPGSFTYTP
ncbi:MAG: Ig-like domain repeat protein, partial [Bryocella sp.]